VENSEEERQMQVMVRSGIGPLSREVSEPDQFRNRSTLATNDTAQPVGKVLPYLVRPPILCEPVGRCNRNQRWQVNLM
jgi:hypothetical protein